MTAFENESEIRPLTARDPGTVGPFTITGRLGAGGMGIVYLGWFHERPVAVKVMREDLADDQQFRARFRREVEVLGRIVGRCTARILEADADADRPYVVTEYVPGPSLADATALTSSTSRLGRRRDRFGLAGILAQLSG